MRLMPGSLARNPASSLSALGGHPEPCARAFEVSSGSLQCCSKQRNSNSQEIVSITPISNKLHSNMQDPLWPRTVSVARE